MSCKRTWAEYCTRTKAYGGMSCGLHGRHVLQCAARGGMRALVLCAARAVPAKVSDLATKDKAHGYTFGSANSEHAEQ